MNHTFHELVVGGVLVAPFLSYAVGALFVIVVIRPVLHSIGFSRIFSHPSVAELSLYVTVLGLLVLLF
jgi:Protein of unknown function (DUF1656)